MALGPIIALVVFGWFADGQTAVISKAFPSVEACQAGLAAAKANLDKNHVAMGLTNAYLECVTSPTPAAPADAPADPAAPAPTTGVDNPDAPATPSGGETQD